MNRRWMAAVLVAAVIAPLGLGGVAHAGSKGRRNTAALLGAVSAFSLLKGKTTPGLLSGAGAVYAYTRYRSAKKDEDRRRERRRSRRYRGGGYYPASYGGYGGHQHYDGCGCSGYSRRRSYSSYGGHRHYDGCGHSGYGGGRPHGWSKGKKVGWGGGHVPPGHRKKHKHKH